MTGEQTPGMVAEHERERRLASPRIYVASLSDYNHGELHGRWLEASVPLEQLGMAIGQLLTSSPEGKAGEAAEEWAIHDYDGFGQLPLSEHESLERVSRVARGIADYGLAFAAWVDVTEPEDEDGYQFVEEFIGHYDSRSAWGDQLVEDYDLEQRIAKTLPAFMQSFVLIDPERGVRDLEAGGAYTITEAEEGGVYVFDSRR